MTDRLQAIVATKRDELDQRKRDRPVASFEAAPRPRGRDFRAALGRPGLNAIAEIKRRSPSRGALRPALDAAEIARGYQHHGAAALSVLTDGPFFGGSDDDLIRARRATELPVLRKDFTLDPYQLHEARALAADAVLLIVRLLSDTELTELLTLAEHLELATLVEAHDRDEVERALAAGATLVGINSRDLTTFDTDLERALSLRSAIPPGVITVAESGIRTRDDIRRVEQAGFDAFLVGEALMTAVDPGASLSTLLGGVGGRS